MALTDLVGRGLGRRRRRRPIDRVLTAGADSEEPGFVARVVFPVIERWVGLAASIGGRGTRFKLRDKLLKAGLRDTLSVAQFQALKLTSALMFPVVIFFNIALLDKLTNPGLSFPPTLYTVLIPCGALLGWMTPNFILNMRIRRRQHIISITLPDLIDLMATCVEAGLGLEGAMDRVADRFRGPLGEEFKRVMQQMQFGRTRDEALREMAQRLEVEELTAFVRALVQANRFGLPIVNVLRLQAEQMRERRFQRAREIAQRAPAKMMVPAAFFVFPALLIVVMGGAAIKAWEALKNLIGTLGF